LILYLEIIQAFQELYPAGLTTSYTSESLPLMREKSFLMNATNDQLSQEGKIDIEERKVPDPEGASEISLLICRSSASLSSISNPILPCIYYAHGGEMILGSNRLGLQFLLDLIVEMKIVVVSIEYRLAPEHPHPAPSEDCFAGLLLQKSKHE
jgi:acetyl esterase/lipase